MCAPNRVFLVFLLFTSMIGGQWTMQEETTPTQETTTTTTEATTTTTTIETTTTDDETTTTQTTLPPMVMIACSDVEQLLPCCLHSEKLPSKCGLLSFKERREFSNNPTSFLQADGLLKMGQSTGSPLDYSLNVFDPKVCGCSANVNGQVQVCEGIEWPNEDDTLRCETWPLLCDSYKPPFSCKLKDLLAHTQPLLTSAPNQPPSCPSEFHFLPYPYSASYGCSYPPCGDRFRIPTGETGCVPVTGLDSRYKMCPLYDTSLNYTIITADEVFGGKKRPDEGCLLPPICHGLAKRTAMFANSTYLPVMLDYMLDPEHCTLLCPKEYNVGETYIHGEVLVIPMYSVLKDFASQDPTLEEAVYLDRRGVLEAWGEANSKLIEPPIPLQFSPRFACKKTMIWRMGRTQCMVIPSCKGSNERGHEMTDDDLDEKTKLLKIPLCLPWCDAEDSIVRADFSDLRKNHPCNPLPLCVNDTGLADPPYTKNNIHGARRENCVNKSKCIGDQDYLTHHCYVPLPDREGFNLKLAIEVASEILGFDELIYIELALILYIACMIYMKVHYDVDIWGCFKKLLSPWFPSLKPDPDNIYEDFIRLDPGLPPYIREALFELRERLGEAPPDIPKPILDAQVIIDGPPPPRLTRLWYTVSDWIEKKLSRKKSDE